MRKKAISLLAVITIITNLIVFSAQATYTPTNEAYTLVNYLNNKVGESFTSNACQSFVYQSLYKCFGVPNTKTSCCATKAWQNYGISSSRDDIPLGAAVYFGGSNVIDSYCGQQAGHVGLYVGDGNIVHAWSSKIKKTTIDYVINCGYPYRGWGWQGEYALAETDTPIKPDINKVVCSTGDATNITSNSATFNGTFTNPSGARIVKRGYQWGTVPTNEGLNHYTWFDCNITWNDGLTHNMTGLQSDTTYYYKLVVKGEDGTTRYGNMKSFTTSNKIYTAKPSNAQLSSSKKYISVGENVTFTISADNATEYAFGIGDGTKILIETGMTGKNTCSYTFTKAGTYYVWGYARNPVGSVEVNPSLTCNVSEPELPYIKAAVKSSSGQCTTEVIVYNIKETCSVIIAGYKSGKLADSNIILYNQKAISATFNGDIDEIKVMVWDSLSTLKPLCEAEEIPSSKWIME